ncbi:MAG: hypothetical protein K8F54_01790 [Altibacter sp.]|uniref:hypothetical protein n=1 Tax=Altibacter sp. TaxID=2024823 RepID=UPI001DF54053|nr:hypothetical protein [Altibacter sp.]MBZ0326312.1 hypothetical protein [Altibacter sp.]
MCNGGPTKIIVTVSATTANPAPPGLSDGVTSLPIGGGNDAAFTTVVVAGQQIQFVPAGDITEITAIQEGSGSDIFKTDPTAANNWTGVIGSLPASDTREYTIFYNVKGAPGNPYRQDPKLQMKV